MENADQRRNSMVLRVTREVFGLRRFRFEIEIGNCRERSSVEVFRVGDLKRNLCRKSKESSEGKERKEEKRREEKLVLVSGYLVSILSEPMSLWLYPLTLFCHCAPFFSFFFFSFFFFQFQTKPAAFSTSRLGSTATPLKVLYCFFFFFFKRKLFFFNPNCSPSLQWPSKI